MGTGIRRAGVPAVVVLCLLSLSCASGARLYVNPEADMAYYKKIAVLPFANLSNDNLAAPRVTRAFVTELLMAARFQIVQPEDFAGALQRMGVSPNPDGTYDSAKLKEAADRLGVKGILRGAVSDYQVQRTEAGDVPIIAFDAELLDAGTGTVVWRSSITKRGRGRLPIIGSGSRSMSRLTQDACAELVGRLRKEAL
jgi:polysaccharide biosynthesis protein PelC